MRHVIRLIDFGENWAFKNDIIGIIGKEFFTVFGKEPIRSPSKKFNQINEMFLDEISISQIDSVKTYSLSVYNYLDDDDNFLGSFPRLNDLQMIHFANH